MALISTGVEYGLHCLIYLTRPYTSVQEASVRDLAELQGVSVDFLAKIFTKLAKAGLVKGTEGVKGGFRLAKPAGDISVHDVVLAIDGKKKLFDCKEIRERCAVFDNNAPLWASDGMCSIHAVMQDAETAMRQQLEKHSLCELAARVEEKSDDAHATEVITWLAQRTEQRTKTSK